jgi:hypothetical protein
MKNTSPAKSVKKGAASRGAKVPSGARTAGKKTSSTAKSARATNAADVVSAATRKSKSPPKVEAKSAPSRKVASKAKAARTVGAKPMALSKKKVARAKHQARELAAQSVAPEMAQAMLDEMGLGNEDAVLEREALREQRERDVLGRLAVAMHRHDDMPNLELAANIVFHLDKDAVGILVSAIERCDDVYAPDAARVLCEVGTRDPELMEDVIERLISLCHEGSSEMLPFAMYALSPMAQRVAESLWDLRELLWSALGEGAEQAEMGRAAAVRLLSALCASGPAYARTLAGGLVDLLGKCMPKDVALYAESVLPALGAAHSHRAKPVLDRRMKELTPAEVARLRRAVRIAQNGGLSAAA